MGADTGLAMFCGLIHKIKPYLAMISLQFGYAGMYIVTMLCFKKGMNHYVLAVYRHVVATIVIAPFAFVLERKIRPKMTFPILARILALGFLEPVLDQNLYYVGLKLTSATFTSVTINILPAVTFIMALIFRLERVNFKKVRSIAKVVGTLVTIGGAMVMTLYKGPIVDIFHGQGRHAAHQSNGSESSDQHWVLGTLMLLGSIVGWSGFFILQSFTLKKYPAELSLTALICIAGTVEGSIVTLIMERDMSVWVIGWDSRLLAAVYTGVICSGLAYYIQGVVIRERGPVFVTSFTPLCMIITAILGSIVLAEQIHLGSIIGAIFIVMGLYLVVWGKAKDHINKPTNQKGGAATELPITAEPETTAAAVAAERCSSKAPPA
ncbi:WAT1-related protein At4g08300-like [Cucurbita pepo subsp. pepo]|uniref:WAT1-related protein At4g08300-like n=1 Tax=Cucurbita pepo subsp. pepo TaxID=3664 RepID=UPI000C9D6F09|nr:WAT1-related protein At4g08300-like [Cucurbita pepo subsp. pepo]